MNEKDSLFAGDGDATGPFVFDERVVRVFPDMIARSVPGYSLVVPLTGMLARRYAQAGTRLYDLGCSLGATTLAMRSAVAVRPVDIVAVDASPAMVASCRNAVAQDDADIAIEVLEADIRDVTLENASVMAMNFTLQFVDPEDRAPLLLRVHDGLVSGGALVLSEKIRFPQAREQAQQTAWHEDYKRARGYSELEIARKRTALENVLQADSETQHIARLYEAGFSRVYRWFQCFSFCSYLALK